MSLFKSKASTLRKIAELPRYRHPADLKNITIRPVKLQKQQIQGRLTFGANQYNSLSQQNLVKQLLPTRSQYRTQKVQNRMMIAGQQFNLWKQYLSSHLSELTQDEKIDGIRRQKVYESYLIAKQRNEERLQMSKTVKLLFQLQKGFKFDIPLHPIVMMKMVHPHYGYLNNYKKTRLSFNDLCSYLQEMVVVSKIFHSGSTLHAHELMSFTFWKLYTQKSLMTLEQFRLFLKQFKFNKSVQEDSIEKLFEYHLRDQSGELSSDNVRFELWRKIFLERGL